MMLLLIYPYWNVNIDTPVDPPIDTPLLIYPYWNVNKEECYERVTETGLLIYPYWNVNGSGKSYHAIKDIAFNLSILECK